MSRGNRGTRHPETAPRPAQTPCVYERCAPSVVCRVWVRLESVILHPRWGEPKPSIERLPPFPRLRPPPSCPSVFIVVFSFQWRLFHFVTPRTAKQHTSTAPTHSAALALPRRPPTRRRRRAVSFQASHPINSHPSPLHRPPASHRSSPIFTPAPATQRVSDTAVTEGCVGSVFFGSAGLQVGFLPGREKKEKKHATCLAAGDPQRNATFRCQTPHVY